MNKFLGMGRLTKEVELRETSNGVKVAQFTIAINRRFKNSNGEYEADFLNCTAWRNTGEFISKHFGKGDMISVVGSLHNRSWEDADGQKRYATDVIVDEAYFCGGKNQNTETTKKTTENIVEDFTEAFTDDLPF